MQVPHSAINIGESARQHLTQVLEEMRREDGYNEEEFQQYLQECEKAEQEPNLVDPDEEEFYREQLLDERIDICADCLLSSIQRGEKPWSIIHRNDLIEIVRPVWVTWPGSLPTADSILVAVRENLPGRFQPIKVFVHLAHRQGMLLLQVPDLKEWPRGARRINDNTLSFETGSPPGPGVSRVVVSDSDWGSPILTIEGVATPTAASSFARTTRNIIACCLSLSLLRHDYPERIAVRSDPAAPVLDTDGTSRSEEERTEEGGEFTFRLEKPFLRFDHDDTKRFLRSLQTAFRLDNGSSEKETTLRHAIWAMAGVRESGMSPFGLLTCMAVAERCLATRLSVGLHRSNGHEKVWPTVRQDLPVEDDAWGPLEELVENRNSVVHGLSFRVSVTLFLRAWRLAWAATQHLLCKAADTKTSQEQLCKAVHRILRAQ